MLVKQGIAKIGELEHKRKPRLLLQEGSSELHGNVVEPVGQLQNFFRARGMREQLDSKGILSGVNAEQ